MYSGTTLLYNLPWFFNQGEEVNKVIVNEPTLINEIFFKVEF